MGDSPKTRACSAAGVHAAAHVPRVVLASLSRRSIVCHAQPLAYLQDNGLRFAGRENTGVLSRDAAPHAHP